MRVLLALALVAGATALVLPQRRILPEEDLDSEISPKEIIDDLAVAIGWPFNQSKTCVSGEYPPPENTAVEWYTLDLDKSPINRWKQLAREKRHDIQETIKSIKNLIRLFPDGEKAIASIELFFPTLLTTIPYQYRMEIIGISQAAEITLGDATFLNAFYEAVPGCTSIIAQDAKGDRIHGRNMDFGLMMGWDFKNHTWLMTEHLRLLTTNVQAVKGNTTVWKSVSYAGYIGIFTGVRAGHFSVTINSREGHKGEKGFIEWVNGNHDQSWTTMLPRTLFESGATYEEAVHHLSNNEMMVSEYYIVSGPGFNEGVVISRNRTTYLDQWFLNQEEGNWNLIQTNYDHWQRQPWFDDRAGKAEQCISPYTPQTIDKSAIFNVLSTNPVLNQLTVYTVLMDVIDGHLESYIRTCPNCFLF